MTYRDDSRWQEAQAAFLADGSDPDDLFTQRIDAAWRMREIERECEPAQPISTT